MPPSISCWALPGATFLKDHYEVTGLSVKNSWAQGPVKLRGPNFDASNSQFTKNKNYSFCIPKKHKHRIGIFQSFAFDWIIPHSVLKEVLTFNISTIGDTPIFSWGIVIRIMSCAYFSRPLALAIMIFSKLIKFKGETSGHFHFLSSQQHTYNEKIKSRYYFLLLRLLYLEISSNKY